MYCQICGSESCEYRERSRMVLCDSCHADTPSKASYGGFLSVTGMKNDSTAREFFDDYRASRHSSVAEYWEACSQ